MAISAEVNQEERYDHISIYMDPVFLPSLPTDVVDRLFFQGISNGVHAGRANAGFMLSTEGDLEVKVLELRVSEPITTMSEEEIESLATKLEDMAQEIVVSLLKDMGTP
jgi:hypothetical protein